MMSLNEGLRAWGKSSAATMVPTRMSTLRNSSKAIVGLASEVGVMSCVLIVGSLELCRAGQSAVKPVKMGRRSGPASRMFDCRARSMEWKWRAWFTNSACLNPRSARKTRWRITKHPPAPRFRLRQESKRMRLRALPAREKWSEIEAGSDPGLSRGLFLGSALCMSLLRMFASDL